MTTGLISVHSAWNEDRLYSDNAFAIHLCEYIHRVEDIPMAVDQPDRLAAVIGNGNVIIVDIQRSFVAYKTTFVFALNGNLNTFCYLNVRLQYNKNSVRLPNITNIIDNMINPEFKRMYLRTVKK